MQKNDNQTDAMILAVDETLSSMAARFNQIIFGNDSSQTWPLIIVQSVGQALRAVHQQQPRVSIVCAGKKHLAATTNLIDAIHRQRPQTSVIAVTDHHDESTERAIRTAGATHYFPLETEEDSHLVRATLQSLVVLAAVTISPGVRTLKRTRASPPATRSRGRPRRSHQL